MICPSCGHEWDTKADYLKSLPKLNGFYHIKDAQLVKESEKASMYDFDEYSLWFPNSQIKVKEDGLWVACWILDKNIKAAE